MPNEVVARLAQPFYAQGFAEQAANAIVKEAANTWKQKEEVIDDITCVVVFLDIKLIERSLRYREQDIQQLKKEGKNTDQERSIVTFPLNQHFKAFWYPGMTTDQFL